MRHSTRIILSATLAIGLVAAILPQPASAFDTAEQKCRSTVVKSGGKYAKTVLKTMTGCHKNRDKNGGATDCNDITAADTKGKVPAAETKFTSSVTGKCTAGTPADVLYTACPAPCDVSVPVITTFAQVAACEICLTRANTEALSSEVNGTPTPAPITDDSVAACHKSILKNGPNLYNSVVKAVAKCQKDAEKGGAETVTGCTMTDFTTLTQSANAKCEAGVQDGCGTMTLPSAALDACGGTPATLFELTACACATSRDAAQEIVTDYLILNGMGGTTTTTSTTSTTTLPGQDPKCPNVGELTLFSKLSNQTCATNTDCTSPRTCDPTLLLCTTVADLDSGWNGAGHDSDIDDGITARANLHCTGPASPTCGVCTVTGLNASTAPGDPGNCRCNNNVLNKCDQPFATDNVNCTGAGSHTCDCYFGAPFPLAAQGTPVCVSNRFSQNITGTANPDLGSGAITASLRTKVFLGITTDLPCPVCGGKCSNDNTGCIFDSDCDPTFTCVQDTPGDGVRNGLCVYNPTTHVGNGVACDSDGTNSSFPAIIGDTAGGNGGAGYSIDCQPTTGSNISGQGLAINLSQTTGMTSLGFGVDCDGAGVGTALCPCLVCSGDQSQPCSSNAECALLSGACALAPDNGGVACSINGDCTAANIGPCNNLFLCSKKQSQVCATNADCTSQPVGPCNLQTCTSDGGGGIPKPNNCLDTICTNQGGGEGQCNAGPSYKYCDALVRSDGTGIRSCTGNADCAGSPSYGLCSILDPADCFLNPIVATGVADPVKPVAGAVFCIPPTSNPGVNSSAGLPGPGRVISQSTAKTFCPGSGTQYNPGGLPACP